MLTEFEHSPKTKKARVPLSSIELDKDADELPEDLEPGSTSTRQLSKSALEKVVPACFCRLQTMSFVSLCLDCKEMPLTAKVRRKKNFLSYLS